MAVYKIKVIDDTIPDYRSLRLMICILNAEAKAYDVEVSGSGSGEGPDFMYEISLSGSPENIKSFMRSQIYRQFMGLTSDADTEDEVK